jgi:hypothetical protein
MWNVPGKEVKAHKLTREIQKQSSKLWNIWIMEEKCREFVRTDEAGSETKGR